MFHLLELSGPGDLPFSLGDDFTCLHPRRKWFRLLPSDFFQVSKLFSWAQVGMLVLNAMNGLTRTWGTLKLRRDTGIPSINKSLIVLANAFRCVHPAVRSGGDLHFTPICVGKAAATDGLTHFSNHALTIAPIKKHGISKQHFFSLSMWRTLSIGCAHSSSTTLFVIVVAAQNQKGRAVGVETVGTGQEVSKLLDCGVGVTAKLEYV